MFQLLGVSKVRIGFYPRDAMPARVLVSYCLSVCVCLSEVGFLVKQLSESSWFFGTGASFHAFILLCVKRKFGYLQK